MVLNDAMMSTMGEAMKSAIKTRKKKKKKKESPVKKDMGYGRK